MDLTCKNERLSSLTCPRRGPNCGELHVTIVYKIVPRVFSDLKGLILEQQTYLGLICHQQTTETVIKG